MTDLRGRLDLLRRQAGVARAVAPPPAAPSVDVAALRRALLRREGRSPATSAAPVALPGDELAPGLRLVDTVLPWDGRTPLRPPRWIEAQNVQRQRFFVFDTETTGLAGGTGTRAFVLGAAQWCDAGLRVRQLYLTTLSGEAAMLGVFADWLAAHHVLVSYNGRCYDAPLLATRYRLQRRDSPLAALPHVDLLHPVRRRFRGVWENCRLATIERRWLDVVREDDLPGAEAPAAWLKYLRFGDARDLVRVLAHNRQDLVSLALLLERMDESESATLHP